MSYIGFDHQKKWTQAAAIDDQGKIIRARGHIRRGVSAGSSAGSGKPY